MPVDCSSCKHANAEAIDLLLAGILQVNNQLQKLDMQWTLIKDPLKGPSDKGPSDKGPSDKGPSDKGTCKPSANRGHSILSFYL